MHEAEATTVGHRNAPAAEPVERRATTKGNSRQPTVGTTQSVKATSSGLPRIREAARRDSSLRFTNLLHHVTIDLLRRGYLHLNREAASGVDGVTWKAYGQGLEVRLADLHERVHSGRYRAQPSKRIWLPKPDGRRRPIGIASVEDKVVQQALVWVLESIYERDFLGFSYGFRPGRHAHQALDAVFVAITQRKVNWVLDADIKSFFDTLDHAWVLKFLQHRVADRRIVRLVRKFLRAGVSEEGKWSRTEAGTPQGGVLSPLLANLYLHYVFDQWVHVWRRRHARGEVYVVRYADDFVVCFQYEQDGRRFARALAERLSKFKLTLHPEKTRLIDFGRFAASNRQRRGRGKPPTFDFLGFTHICGKRRSDGRFALRRQSVSKRVTARLRHIRRMLMRGRARPVARQGRWLRAVVTGFFNYHAVPGNSQAMSLFRKEVNRAWLRALRRRSQKGSRLTWQRMQRLIATWIPRSHIRHPYPNRRFAMNLR